MKSVIKSKSICGRPVHSYFTGIDKYLRLQKHSISDVTPPISENESLFILVTSGRGLIFINGVEFPFEAGAFVWIQSYHTFSIQPYSDSPLEICVCVYDYALSSFLVFEDPEASTINAITDAQPILYPEGELLSKIQYLFKEFEIENENYDPGSSLIKVSILGQLSSIFIKNSIKHNQDDVDNVKPLGWKVILYTSVHFAKDINAESVANHFNSTVAVLNRELRNISGYNFDQTLNRIRVNIASTALLYVGMSLSYIATYSGFSSEALFYRNFKKYMGTTPQKYRNQILNSGDGVYRGMIMESTLMKILNHSYSNSSSPINISNTSKDLYISENVIRDLIYEKFGTTYNDLTSLTRVRHAEALLLTTDLPIMDIAINVGFNCPRTLSRAFYNIHGLPPSEYRLIHND